MKFYLILFVSILTLSGCSDRPIPQPIAVEVPKAEVDGCTAKVMSKLVSERKVGPITNLVKEETKFGYKNQCKVNFDITVDGQVYHLERIEEGLYQMGVICADARDMAREELLLDLGGIFKSDAEFICYQRDQNGKIDN